MSALSGWCLRCCSMLEKTGYTKFAVRRYARGRLKPLGVSPRKVKDDDDADAFFTRVDPKVMEELKRSHDGEFEPEVNNFEAAYSEYERELGRYREKTNRMKMVRKHFKSTVTKELNLLTYAEKEKIRYLHKSDPEQWNAETIARSFPISEEGVANILRSSFRANSLEQIENHDQLVIDRLCKIKSGEIPMTKELQAKLRIRNQIPVKPGLGTFSAENFAAPKKPLGQFGKLVALPKAKDSELKSPALLTNYDDERVAQGHELRQLRIDPTERMTLSEFEEEVKAGLDKTDKSRSTHPNSQVNYLLQVKEKPVLAELLKGDEQKVENPELKEPTLDDYIYFGKIQKFKNSRLQEKVEVSVENGQPYIYELETGYQKPYANAQDNDTIRIPQDKRNPDSVYRVGDSYYDYNGEFLYKVI